MTIDRVLIESLLRMTEKSAQYYNEHEVEGSEITQSFCRGARIAYETVSQQIKVILNGK